MLVELGGGTAPHPRADVVVDTHHPRRSQPQDATVKHWLVDMDVPGVVGRQDWTQGHLGGGTVDEVYSSHFLEHVPAGDKLLAVMGEAWRVLRPGGSFTAVLPVVGHTHPRSGVGMSTHAWQPWADPTHVSYWWLPERLHYFTGQLGADADYGLDMWLPVEYVPEDQASAELEWQRMSPAPRSDLGSWWTVRGGWEGVFRLVKP